jgi:hypothetical protein
VVSDPVTRAPLPSAPEPASLLAAGPTALAPLAGVPRRRVLSLVGPRSAAVPGDRPANVRVLPVPVPTARRLVSGAGVTRPSCRPLLSAIATPGAPVLPIAKGISRSGQHRPSERHDASATMRQAAHPEAMHRRARREPRRLRAGHVRRVLRAVAARRPPGQHPPARPSVCAAPGVVRLPVRPAAVRALQAAVPDRKGRASPDAADPGR